MSALRRTCREVTRLVLEGQDRRLSATERVALRLHWLACGGCSRFRRQVEVMRGALGRWQQYRESDENEPG